MIMTLNQESLKFIILLRDWVLKGFSHRLLDVTGGEINEEFKNLTYEYYDDNYIGEDIEPNLVTFYYEEPDRGSGSEFTLVSNILIIIISMTIIILYIYVYDIIWSCKLEE